MLQIYLINYYGNTFLFYILYFLTSRLGILTHIKQERCICNDSVFKKTCVQKRANL